MCKEVPQPQPCHVLPKKPPSVVQTFPVPYLTYLNIQIIKCVSYIVHPTEYSPAENENDRRYCKPLRVDSIIDIVPFPELSQCLPQKFPDLEN